MIRHYELGLVINPDLAEDQIEAQVLRVGQAIETRNGQITHLDKWGRRRMSYPIDRHRDGYYAFIDMDLDTTAVREVENLLRVQENVMRHLITMIDPRTIEERRRRHEQEANRAAAAAAMAAQRAADVAAAQAAQAARASEAAQPGETMPASEAAPPSQTAPATDAAETGESATPALPATPQASETTETAEDAPAAPVTDETTPEA